MIEKRLRDKIEQLIAPRIGYFRRALRPCHYLHAEHSDERRVLNLAGGVTGGAAMVRAIALIAGLTTALPAIAGEMTASEARQFVIERLFNYTCFDGTRGMARVHADGSVDGSIQSRGAGLMRYGTMPLGTLRVEGQRVCASLPGAVIQPCFYLERTTAESFRGSIAGLSFAYCDFTRARTMSAN